MIFENIIAGNFPDGFSAVLYALFTALSAFVAVCLSALIQKAFMRKSVSFSKTVFSVPTVFTVISSLFFYAAAVKNNDCENRKRSALSALVTLLLFAAAGFIFTAVLYPVLKLSLLFYAGIVFSSVAALNVLPLPGFLMFSFIKNIASDSFCEKLSKLEKYKVFFVVFALITVTRSGLLNSVLTLIMTGAA